MSSRSSPPDLSIDAQVTSFSWDGSGLTLVDVGTPFLWDENGKLRFDMKPFIRMLPAPTRRLAARELTKLVTRWNDPRRVGIDIVANLYREGSAATVRLVRLVQLRLTTTTTTPMELIFIRHALVTHVYTGHRSSGAEADGFGSDASEDHQCTTR